MKKKIEETNKVKSPPWVDFHSNELQAFIGFDVWQAVARKKNNQPVSTVCCSCLLNLQTSLVYMYLFIFVCVYIYYIYIHT